MRPNYSAQRPDEHSPLEQIAAPTHPQIPPVRISYEDAFRPSLFIRYRTGWSISLRPIERTI
jgi:hypothetical protein